MKITFIGAAHEVTGSAHFLEVGGKYLLVDYGTRTEVTVAESSVERLRSSGR